jgi:hypothetical protein
VLVEGLYMVRRGDIATGENMNPSEHFSFTERTLVGWISVS